MGDRKIGSKPFNDKALADAALRMALLSDAGSGPGDIAAAGLGLDGAVDMTQEQDIDTILSETGRFPEYFINMMGVGLETGKLPECLRALHDYYARSHRLKLSVRQAVYQPLFMLAISILIFAVILVKIFPVFGAAYASAGMQIGTAMAWLLMLSQDISARPVFYTACCAAPFVIIALCVFIKPVRGVFSGLFNHTKTGMSIRNAKLVQALSMGLDSGMDLESAMAMAMDVSGVTDVGPILDAIREKSVGQVLYDQHMIGKSDERILSAGERAGNLPDAMAYLAGELMDDADHKVRLMSARIEPVITLIGAALAGGIILTSMLPLLDAISSIG